MTEQRKVPRLIVGNMQADVSDGIGCCSGIVHDISFTGLCLVDVTKRFGKKVDAYTVVATCDNRHFKFRVRRRWEEVRGPNKRMGVEIAEPPGPWIEYVRGLEAQFDT